MKMLIATVSALALFSASPALATDYSQQSAIMKKKLQAGGQGINIPTGYEVAGCTEYVLDGGVRQVCDVRDFGSKVATAKFWEEQRKIGGSEPPK